MSRAEQTFRQCDVTKALKAVAKAGIAVERVEIDKNGKVVIVAVRGENAPNGPNPEKNEWDGVLP